MRTQWLLVEYCAMLCVVLKCTFGTLFPPLYNWWGLVSMLAEIVEVSWQKKAPELSLLQLPRSHDLGWAKLVSVGLLCSRD